MFKIIQKESIEDSEDCLSKLLINNFYENILSASYIEDELLPLIGRSLREEINQYFIIFNYNWTRKLKKYTEVEFGLAQTYLESQNFSDAEKYV